MLTKSTGQRMLSVVIAGTVLCGAAMDGEAELVKTFGDAERSPAQKNKTVIVGNVKAVLDGEATGSQVLEVDPGTFSAGLGAGILNADPEQQGETLVLGNTVFVKSVEASAGYKTTSLKSRRYYSSFIAGIPRNAKPAAKYEVRGSTTTMEQIYGQLVKTHGPLIAVTGEAEFETLEQSAIKRAPCYGEPILGGNKEKYFHPSAVFHDLKALTFGLVMRSASDATSSTARIFYINPDDRGSTGTISHSHFARLRKNADVDPTDLTTAEPQVEEVAHLLTQSSVKSGEFVVYELETTH